MKNAFWVVVTIVGLAGLRHYNKQQDIDHFDERFMEGCLNEAPEYDLEPEDVDDVCQCLLDGLLEEYPDRAELYKVMVDSDERSELMDQVVADYGCSL